MLSDKCRDQFLKQAELMYFLKKLFFILWPPLKEMAMAETKKYMEDDISFRYFTCHVWHRLYLFPLKVVVTASGDNIVKA
jgi:hypothetical protein